jgi:hypothetical protein
MATTGTLFPAHENGTGGGFTEQTVTIETPHDMKLLGTAVRARAERLAKLAKDNTAEGYAAEARVVKADAERLAQDLAPKFEDQAEIPLATADEVRGAVGNELRQLVRMHAAHTGDDGVDHEAKLLHALGLRIAAFGARCAEQGFAAGVQYREAQPEVIALKASEALRYTPSA